MRHGGKLQRLGTDSAFMQHAIPRYNTNTHTHTHFLLICIRITRHVYVHIYVSINIFTQMHLSLDVRLRISFNFISIPNRRHSNWLCAILWRMHCLSIPNAAAHAFAPLFAVHPYRDIEFLRSMQILVARHFFCNKYFYM